MLDTKSHQNVTSKPVITVCGIGGAGNNAVNNMIKSELQGANFIAANTDAQSLDKSLAKVKIQLGVSTTKGLGAGSVPSVGSISADESREEIRKSLEGSNMVFITAGMGGGTGTGSAPIFAKIAKEMGILTVAVVTKPFDFEGPYRMQIALKGLEDLRSNVNTLIIIPNQNIFSLSNENTTFLEAFEMSDQVLNSAIRSITDLTTMTGIINLDFADIKTVMSSMGAAVIGIGEFKGDITDEDRAISAAKEAVCNPLLSHSSISGAKGVIINVTGGTDMTLNEVNAAANYIRESVNNDSANIIFGSYFDENLENIIRVSVIATGIDIIPEKDKKENKFLSKVYGDSQKNYSKSLYSVSQNFEVKKSSDNKFNNKIVKNSEEKMSKITFNPINHRDDAEDNSQIQKNFSNIYEMPTFLRNKDKQKN